MCKEGQICCNGRCVSPCCEDNECPEGECCQNGCCHACLESGSLCSSVVGSDLTDYADTCINFPGTCDFSRYYAFDSIDLTSLFPNDITVDIETLISINHNSIYCCQDGKNCDDGFSGCGPTCTACCDVDDCTQTIRCSRLRLYVCSSTSCDNWQILVPNLLTTPSNYLAMDWSSLDFANNSYTCADLKALRTQTDSSFGRCQEDSGKVDDDFPCMLQLFSVFETSSSCPTNCSNNKKR